MDREAVAKRREALRPRCEHGTLRATSQIGKHGHCGPAMTCTCCRSGFGYLGDKPLAGRCPNCRPKHEHA